MAEVCTFPRSLPVGENGRIMSYYANLSGNVKIVRIFMVIPKRSLNVRTCDTRCRYV